MPAPFALACAHGRALRERNIRRQWMHLRPLARKLGIRPADRSREFIHIRVLSLLFFGYTQS